ncbi:zinc-ribbon domain-containing protein [Candidatus Saccharibacteria bacterium]|nr:zinc-ribbon domain-containing protein [Candidatus Saccharibacteria bacterium]
MGKNKFCSKCGSEILKNSNFCSKCGNKIGTFDNKKKKIIITTLCLVTALVIGASVLALKMLVDKPYTRTVMVYMIGSDLESSQSSASLDINEMKEAGFNQDDTKVLVYTGGSKSWALDNIDPNKNTIFEVKNGENVMVKEYSKKPMTQAKTLTEFVNYVTSNYESNYYDLILWDHGGGPIYGYGRDENTISKTPMSLKTLKKALSDTKLSSKQKFEFIGFDACLMGSLEVAKFLQPFSDYMIASEEVEPGLGWNYNFLKNLNNRMDTETVGRDIINTFMDQYKDTDYDLSLAMVKLSSIKDIISSAETLFDKINGEVTADTFSKYSLTLTREKVYGYNGRDDSSYDLVDLKDLSDSVASQYPNEVKSVGDSVAQAVIYSRNNIDYTNGLSVYFPTNNKNNINKIIAKYKDVSFSDKYYNFLKRYSGFISGDPMVKTVDYKDIAIKSSKEGTVSATLPAELSQNYQSGEIIILRKIGEDRFLPVFRSSDVIKDGNSIRTTSTHLQFVAQVTKKNGSKEYGWIVTFEKERTNDHVEYVTFGMAGYEDKNKILGFVPKSYEAHLWLPSGKNTAKIKDIRVTSGKDGLASKENLDQKKIKFLEFLVPTLTSEYESVGQDYGTSVSFEKGEKIVFKLVDLDFDFGDMYEGHIPRSSMKDYYAQFIIHDTQGYSHRLNMLHIN